MQVPTDGADGTAYLIRLGTNISFDQISFCAAGDSDASGERRPRSGACAGGIEHDTSTSPYSVVRTSTVYAACTKGTAYSLD
eukprot:scaffold381201_cov22-Prasinocladus_malaysianus.AAC.1